MGILSTTAIVQEINKSFQKSEGWMLTYPLESQTYSPENHSFKSTKVIQNHNLKVSFPHSKYKIPKKRLWNDGAIECETNNDKVFVKQAQFDLWGATIELVPVGLSRKRIWKKKYPISISLALPYLQNLGTKNVSKKMCGDGKKMYRKLIYASKCKDTSLSFATDLASFVNSMKQAFPHLNYTVYTPITPKEDWVNLHEIMFSPSFLNVMVTRLFYDFLRSPSRLIEIWTRIEKKLAAARKPAFVESIQVKELDLGHCLPRILPACSPLIDSRGIWMELEIEYVGKMAITLEIVVNFLTMRVERGSEISVSSLSTTRKQPIYDSEADDSGDASEPEWLKRGESVAKSFVKNKHVHKLAENIAAAPLQLTVEVTRVAGTLVVNIPPVPSDRIWVGFSTNPVVELEVNPKFGERLFGYHYLKEFIKKKLLLEFQRAIVYPNMTDLIVEIMEFNWPK
ncbi:Testis-expressed sequence 2 protein [Orchesella cincta]|uniref:Testis-expressed sequence 2 protein n=1 Tax=Orchesella cincta TaxID=48709 RepID=A0A1D2MI37_ORCCI|nr:Testis-expressed sequence 2 protein [Orchesella cincta]